MTRPAPASCDGGGRFFFGPPKQHSTESRHLWRHSGLLATSGDENSPLLWTTNAQSPRMITPDRSLLQRPVDGRMRKRFAAVTGVREWERWHIHANTGYRRLLSGASERLPLHAAVARRCGRDRQANG